MPFLLLISIKSLCVSRASSWTPGPLVDGAGVGTRRAAAEADAFTQLHTQVIPMDTLLGIVGKDFVILAADAGQVRSIMRLKDDADKIYEVRAHRAELNYYAPGACVLR